MTFKTLMKRQQRMMNPRTVKFLGGGKIIISRDLRNFFKKKEFVEILIDEDYNKIAFKPSNDEVRGYKLVQGNVFQCMILFRSGIKGEYKARFTEGKIIIDDIPITDKLKNMEFWED